MNIDFHNHYNIYRKKSVLVLLSGLTQGTKLKTTMNIDFHNHYNIYIAKKCSSTFVGTNPGNMCAKFQNI